MSLSPVYFGPSNGHLFGMYDPSLTGGDEGAVLCAPWGGEYFCAHQSLRHLSRLLTHAGVNAFRFDYSATGDSSGNDIERSVARWIQDTTLAIEELKDTAGVRRVSVIGLRLGAAIAAMVARSRADIDRVVLWDPVFDGGSYLEEVARTRHVNDRTFPLDIAGTQVSEAEYSEIRALSLGAFDGPLPSTLIIDTQTPHASESLATHLRERNIDVATQFHAGPAAWLEIGNFGAAGMPVAALHAIAQWLAP